MAFSFSVFRRKKTEKKMAAFRDWSDLPRDLLEIIADCLQTQSDVSRFRSVCQSWRFSVLPFQKRIFLPPRVPYLGLPAPTRHETCLPLTESTIYYLAPPAADRMDSGPWGWLVKLKQGSRRLGRLHVLNPLSSLRINPLPEYFPKVINSLQFRVFELAKAYTLQFSNLNRCNYKVALSPNPDSASLMFVTAGVLWHLKLKLGHAKWTAIDDMLSQMSYHDVTLYDGKFCAVDEYGRAVRFDEDSLKVTEIASPVIHDGDKKTLLVSNGELLLVDTYLREQQAYNGGMNSYTVQKFIVFKLKVDKKRWVKLQSLDDRILFLGEDCSFSLSARNFGGCKGNCIICTDPCFTVYNLDDGLLPLAQHPEYTSIFYPPSTWPIGLL